MDDKNTSTSGATEATASSSRAHHAGDGGAVAGGPKRFSAKRKLAVVQRLLRGESLEGAGRLCSRAQRIMAPAAPRVQDTRSDQGRTKSP